MTARRAALALAVAVNLVLLYWPRSPGAAGVPGVDKLVHLATFAALTWTGLRAGLGARWWLPVLGLHAVTSEVVQAMVLPRRSGDLLDVVADLVGVLVGVLLARASWSDGPRGDDHPGSTDRRH